MSLSKEEATAAPSEEEELAPRRPKCTRCRHHGIIVLLKGHRKWCPFLRCDCWKCYLITQRTQISNLQRSLKRGQDRGQSRPQPQDHRGKKAPATGSPGPSPSPPPPLPDGGARPPPPPTSGLAAPRRSAGAPGGADGPTPRELQTPRDSAAAAAGGGEPVVGLEGQGGPPNVHYLYTSHFPSSFGLWPKIYNVQQLPLHPPPPPPPPGFYNGPCPVFASFQHGAANYPPLPPEPGPPDCRRVFFTLQPPPPLTDGPVQEEMMSRPPPHSSSSSSSSSSNYITVE